MAKTMATAGGSSSIAQASRVYSRSLEKRRNTEPGASAPPSQATEARAAEVNTDCLQEQIGSVSTTPSLVGVDFWARPGKILRWRLLRMLILLRAASNRFRHAENWLVSLVSTS